MNIDIIKNIDNKVFLNEGLNLLQKGDKSRSGIRTSRQDKPEDNEDYDEENILFCTLCKYPITKMENRINVNDKNEHVFANPHGYVFHISCFSQAPGCILYGEETSYFSWFSGYTWRIALCRQCGTLLGWFFRSKDLQFFGIIIDNIN